MSAEPGAALGRVLAKFQGVIKNGASWKALCPAHADMNPSLSICEKDGKILLHCHAGCETDSVCLAAGIQKSELFTHHGNGRQKTESAGKITATYDYTDENGHLLYQTVRYEPKDFKQRRPDGNGGWTWNLGSVRRVLYRLPEVLTEKFVLVCEGEKDCETAPKLGLVATTNVGGAGKWRNDYSPFLSRKSVIIIADADEAGRKHAQQVAASLWGVAATLKAIELPGAKDLTDWVAGGGIRDALLGFIESQPEWKPNADWRGLFHTFAEFENAPPLDFAIQNFLQNDAATVIGGLSGHGKTWVQLSIVKALLTGKKLWNLFDVTRAAERVLYLIPESAIGPFGHRLKLFGLLYYVQMDRLFVRTLSKGPKPQLDDPLVLTAAEGAYVFLDTLARFTRGDENSSAEFQALADDTFGLLRAGARAVIAAHHSPKSFRRETVMELENMLRGTGDIGAIFATGYGLKQLDPDQNIVQVQCIKARDFEPSKPFQLIGRPHISEQGDFAVLKRPGECGPLEQEEPDRNKGGAPQALRDARKANLELLRRFIADNPEATSEQLAARFAEAGIKLSPVTVRKYRKAL